ncbi:MAG: CotH kinase family protein [Saprospiraceae bacterium]
MKKINHFLYLLAFLFASSALFGQDFYQWNEIREIRLSFPRDNWASILERMKDAGQEQRMTAKLEIDGKSFEEVGVRFKGNSSFKSVKKGGAVKLPFNIKIDYKDKKQELDGGYETIKLSNCFRDPSFVREVISYEIARKYMPASRCNYAKLYVNDQYLGIYSNTESVDKPLLKRTFDEKDGVFVKCDPEWDTPEPKNCLEGDKASLMYVGEDPRCYMANYEMKSDSGWASFIQFIEALNNPDKNIEEYLHVDQALWMHAFNNVMVNLDSYTGRLSHNYYVYRDKTGSFTPIVWDFNLSLGGFRFDGSGKPLDNEEMATLSPYVHFKNKNKKRPLIVNLLSDGLYRKMYIAHIKTILEENFNNGEFNKRVEELHAFIAEEIRNDPVKLYSFENFEKNLNSSVDLDGVEIIGVKELMNRRLEYLNQHPLITAETPQITKVEHIRFGEDLAVQASLEGATAAWVFYKSSPELPWKKMELFDKGGTNDQSFQDGVFGNSLPFSEGTQYYIVAENERAASIYPPRASKEPLMVVTTNSN